MLLTLALFASLEFGKGAGLVEEVRRPQLVVY